MILGMFVESLVSAIDTAFLGRVGEIETGASAIAGTFYLIFFCLGSGFCNGTQILIGYRNGEKAFSKIGRIVENSLYCIWAYSAIACAFIFLFAPFILDKVVSSDLILSKTIDFLQIRIFTLFFSLANVVLRAFFIGVQKHVKHVTIASILCAAVNFVLDYIMIFGKFGCPKMGLEGAALASVICEIVAFAYLVIVVLVKSDRKLFQMFRFSLPDFKLMKENIKLSFYLMLQNLFSLISWFLLFAIIEKTGEHNLAASNMSRSYYVLFLTPLWAYQWATNSFVSNALGARQVAVVYKIVKKVVIMSLVTGIIVCLPMFCFPRQIMAIFTSDPNLIDIGSRIFYPIGIGTIIASISQILVSTVAATNNTKFVLIMEFTSVIFYLAWAVWAASSFPNHIEFTWFGESLYYIILLFMSLWFLKSGKWKRTATAL
jgi:putative MATE family efflux protein